MSDILLKQLRGAYSDESRMNLMHYCDLVANEIERLQNENALLKREVLAADAIVTIGNREMVVHHAVKAEIEKLRTASKAALAKLEKGAPGWGVAKDFLRAALNN